MFISATETHMAPTYDTISQGYQLATSWWQLKYTNPIYYGRTISSLSTARLSISDRNFLFLSTELQSMQQLINITQHNTWPREPTLKWKRYRNGYIGPCDSLIIIHTAPPRGIDPHSMLEQSAKGTIVAPAEWQQYRKIACYDTVSLIK